jgi:hypothetical protein
VLLVTTDTPSASGADGMAGAAIGGVVIAVGAVTGDGTQVVDVEVANTDAPALASRAAAGRVAIVLEPKG